MMMATAPAAAFIGHQASAADYLDLFRSARGADLPPLRGDQITALLRHLDPMPICDLMLRSPVGTVVKACYLDAFLLVDEQWQPAKAVHRVQAACYEAARTGARLVTLGGFSSIVGESARFDPSRQFGIPFTTGNTLTAGIIAEQAVISAAGSERCRITVVGAGGDVGSGVCRILHARGFCPTLVGRRPRPLTALAAELPGTAVQSWTEAAQQSDVVVLVSSAARGGVPLEDVASSCVVLDAGHPPNANPGSHARYARSGRVALSCALETDLPALLQGYAQGELHACLAEGMVLALEGRWEAYSVGRGRITPSRAAEILGLADRHGILPAPLRFEPLEGEIGGDCRTPALRDTAKKDPGVAKV